MMKAEELNQNGFAIMAGVYSSVEINAINEQIHLIHGNKPLFGERQFLQRTPGLLELLLSESMRKLINEVAPKSFFIKSIYFDKPPASNWRVNWHQDLTIYVQEKIETLGFKNWTKKNGEFGVQPPTEYLGNIVALRIHLDDTDETNGALKVIPHSHSVGVLRSQTVSFTDSDSVTCSVPAGGVMLMKPLLFHSSSRTTTEKQRRVIHLELCSLELPEKLEWSQKVGQ
jgi:ectoine hydroxylase-related dioxygenase (phytanoyl-CoA dioxygenase family)